MLKLSKYQNSIGIVIIVISLISLLKTKMFDKFIKWKIFKHRNNINEINFFIIFFPKKMISTKKFMHKREITARDNKKKIQNRKGQYNLNRYRNKGKNMYI